MVASPTGTAGKSLRFALSPMTSVVFGFAQHYAHGFVSSASRLHQTVETDDSVAR